MYSNSIFIEFKYYTGIQVRIIDRILKKGIVHIFISGLITKGYELMKKGRKKGRKKRTEGRKDDYSLKLRK